MKIMVNQFDKNNFNLRVRIPGYARNEAFPSNLYQFQDNSVQRAVIKVNGQEFYYTLDKGYAIITRDWKKGDVVEVALPMEVRRVAANENVKSDIGKTAILRGPIVYCAEFADNNGRASNLVLSDNATFTTEYRKDLLNGVMVLKSKATAVNIENDGTKISSSEQPLTLIPFYARCNRGVGEMRIWLPKKIVNVDLLGY